MMKIWRNPGSKEVKERILQAPPARPPRPPLPPPPPEGSSYTREVDRPSGRY